MAPHGDRFDRIRDLARDISKLDFISDDMRKYLGPEMGALNVKQTEAIITLVEAVRGIIAALGALNKEMTYLTADENEVRMTMGGASIRMKKDGTLNLKGKDLDINGTGDIGIKAAKDLHLKGSNVE